MLRMGAPFKGSDGYEDGYDWEDWDLRAVTIFNPLQSRFFRGICHQSDTFQPFDAEVAQLALGDQAARATVFGCQRLFA